MFNPLVGIILIIVGSILITQPDKEPLILKPKPSRMKKIFPYLVAAALVASVIINFAFFTKYKNSEANAQKYWHNYYVTSISFDSLESKKDSIEQVLSATDQLDIAFQKKIINLLLLNPSIELPNGALTFKDWVTINNLIDQENREYEKQSVVFNDTTKEFSNIRKNAWFAYELKRQDCIRQITILINKHFYRER